MKRAQTNIEEVHYAGYHRFHPKKLRGIYWAFVLASATYMGALRDLHQLHPGPVLSSTYREAYLNESPVGFASATSTASPVSDISRNTRRPNIGTDLQGSTPRYYETFFQRAIIVVRVANSASRQTSQRPWKTFYSYLQCYCGSIVCPSVLAVSISGLTS